MENDSFNETNELIEIFSILEPNHYGKSITITDYM
jgi:hypothetical protein